MEEELAVRRIKPFARMVHREKREGVGNVQLLAAVLGTMAVTVACSFAIFFSSGRSTLRICAASFEEGRKVAEIARSERSQPARLSFFLYI